MRGEKRSVIDIDEHNTTTAPEETTRNELKRRQWTGRLSNCTGCSCVHVFDILFIHCAVVVQSFLRPASNLALHKLLRHV